VFGLGLISRDGGTELVRDESRLVRSDLGDCNFESILETEKK